MLFHTARAMCLAWSPDSAKIVSGGIDTNICVWDAKKGEKITMIKGMRLWCGELLQFHTNDYSID